MKSKKILVGAFIGLLILMLFGCGSTPAPLPSTTAPTESTTTHAGIDLDVAIREAAAQMETRIPTGTMIALVSVASPSNAFSTQVLTRLESAVVGSGKLVVVDRANLDKVREEQGFQLSGEVDDESAKSIGRLLGAGAIVTGSLADLGDVYSLTLKAINIETATVAVSYLADLTKTTRIETLLATRDNTTTVRTQPTTASTSQQQAPALASDPAPEPVVPSAPLTPVYRIGDKGPAGGIIFYDKGNDTGGWRYLEVALEDVGQARWGSRMVTGASAAEIGAGRRNTRVLAGYSTGVAAQLCQSYNHEGYNDWYLPSKDELNLMYTNLERRGIGNFNLSGFYWSSTEINDACAWMQRFSDGFQEGRAGNSTAVNFKERSYFVRPIRHF